ncbi:hypothetical protein HanRHA438_Chr11g0492211 [Helianthus annuus]|nr:hypothetical protein HanRHA438_Chr11g0492211 [Helianthus annuus]
MFGVVWPSFYFLACAHILKQLIAYFLSFGSSTFVSFSIPLLPSRIKRGMVTVSY